MPRKPKNNEITETITFTEFDDAPNFSELEFCKVGCHKSDMQPGTLRRLQRLRDIVGCPLTISSAYRSPYHDRIKGRSGSGPHTIGAAVDLVCESDSLRFKIVAAALQVGFTRIGIGRNFVHLDDSNNHKQNVFWTYYK